MLELIVCLLQIYSSELAFFEEENKWARTGWSAKANAYFIQTKTDWCIHLSRMWPWLCRWFAHIRMWVSRIHTHALHGMPWIFNHNHESHPWKAFVIKRRNPRWCSYTFGSTKIWTFGLRESGEMERIQVVGEVMVWDYSTCGHIWCYHICKCVSLKQKM